MDNRLKYLKNMIMTILVYTVLFEQFFWGDTVFFNVKDEMWKMISATAGLPHDAFLILIGEDRIPALKWIIAELFLFVLAGRETYNRLKHLKYMAVIRYGSYRKFYFSLMNETVFRALIFGFVGVGTTCVLYSFQGSGIIGNRALLMMGMIYLSNILLLCLLQTVCMILIENNAASILLFVIWIIIQLHGWQLGNNIWIWLPPNWGMYLRSADIAEKGVPYIAYIIQIVGCIIIWILSPIALSKLKKRTEFI